MRAFSISPQRDGTVMILSKKINIRPTSSVYATYKRLSYQPWTAIAEFVDNSTQSFYDHKEELMAQKYAKGLNIAIRYIEDAVEGDRLEITDDAYGMEWTDFQRAVVLDRPPQNTSGRNEFGMGLKTAACWFGSLWSVESTQLNSTTKYYTEINIDELGKYKTEEIDVREEAVSKKDHFTKIVIKRLNKRIVGPRTIGKVKELLSSIYREDLRTRLVKITYNGHALQFKEAPVYTDDDSKNWKKDITFTVQHEGKELEVSGFIAIRIPGSVKDAGFTLIRRGRVIVGGSEKNYRPSELFGDANSYAWQRMYGELHMDNWPVTQAKDGFDWHNSGLEEAFIDKLSVHTQDYRRKAENIRVREKLNTQDLVETATKGLTESGAVENVKIEIVDCEPVIQEPPADVPIPNTEPSSPEPAHTEKTQDNQQENTKTSSSSPETSETSSQNQNRGNVQLEGGKQINYAFTYKHVDYQFHIILEVNDPAMDWLLVEQLSDAEYNLSINMRHSFFKPLIDKSEFLPIMMKMSIALVLAEIESMVTSHDGRIEPSAIRLKMNEILETVRKGDEAL